MSSSPTAQLKAAQRAKTLVRFSRRFESSRILGYILDVGPKFFLLALVSDRIWFEGFECLRIGDVRGLKPDPYADFIEAALRKRERKARKPRVDVSSVENLLSSAGRLFPLVTIHLEKADPDVCWIGRIVGVGRGRVSMLLIDPAAKWHDLPSSYRLSEITRVGFGADYEGALHLVAGRCNKDMNEGIYGLKTPKRVRTK